MTLPLPGLREKVYLGGHRFNRPPDEFGLLEPAPLEMAQRTGNGRLRRDHNLIFPGCCDRPQKYVFQLGLSGLLSADQAHARKLLALSGDLDFCPWLEIAESFWFLEGEPYTGVLQRRDAVSQCPISPPSMTRYAPRLEIDDAAATLTLSAPDSEYHTTWSAAGSAPAGGSLAVVWYTALWRVQLSQAHVSPARPHRTNARFVLPEV